MKEAGKISELLPTPSFGDVLVKFGNQVRRAKRKRQGRRDLSENNKREGGKQNFSRKSSIISTSLRFNVRCVFQVRLEKKKRNEK